MYVLDDHHHTWILDVFGGGPDCEQFDSAGFRAVVHDRRNTWAADVGFGDGSKTELDLQVDLHPTLCVRKNMLFGFGA